MSWPFVHSDLQLCTVDDIVPDEPPCRRLAQIEWRPDGPDSHPVYLCHFHGEVFYPLGPEP